MKRETAKPGSVPYAGERLGISIPTVYRLMREGRLRAFKIGRATRISDQAISDCIATLEREQPYRTALSAA